MDYVSQSDFSPILSARGKRGSTASGHAKIDRLHIKVPYSVVAILNINAYIMAEEEPAATRRFIAHSILDFIIPEASQLDIEEALSSASANADDDAPTGLAAIPQRKTLFFGKASLPFPNTRESCLTHP